MCLTHAASEIPKFLGVGPDQWAKAFMNISRLYCVLGVAQDLGTELILTWICIVIFRATYILQKGGGVLTAAELTAFNGILHSAI